MKRNSKASVPTFTATIWLGLRRGYGDHVHDASEVEEFCQRHVDAIGLCVTVSPTKFIYKNGNEPGVAIGLINYPRFPSPKNDIRKQAIVLAEHLRCKFGQNRMTVVFPDDTVMLEDSKDGGGNG